MSSSAVSVRDNVINLEVCERTIRSEGESIDKLDDDALIQILCCLPLRDAARTSVLSRRWRYLWRRSLIYPLNPIRSEAESIDKLDDDALIQILCCLPLRDAARTSVLSRRWSYRTNLVKFIEKDVKKIKEKARERW